MKASVRLGNCAAAVNKQSNGIVLWHLWQSNVDAKERVSVILVGCKVADSLERFGLIVSGKGTDINAKDTAFKGSCLCGVYVKSDTIARLDICTAAGNMLSKEEARGGVGVNLASCSAALSLEHNGLHVCAEGTHVEGKDTTFQQNCLCGVHVGSNSSVFLVKCTATGNEQNNVEVEGGVPVDLAGCTVANSLERNGLYVPGKSTNIEAKDTAFQRNHLRGVYVNRKANMRLDDDDAVAAAALSAYELLMRCLGKLQTHFS
jgi:hypothetical protein